MGDYNINGLAIPLFLFFMLVEYLYLRLRGRKLHRFNDTVNSLSMGLCLLVSDALLKAYTFAIFSLLFEQYRFLDFAIDDPITWLLSFLGVDFCYYWFHRVAHERNFLWGAHVGHHQSEEYNLTTALRQSAFQYGFSWIFYLPLALLGCPPIVFLIQFMILKLYQFWIHTQAINRIPLIEGIFSTPSSHRVHHAKNPCYIDRNYGGTLVIWDRLFNTWQPELSVEPCHYGTTRPLDTLSPIKANFQHWSMLFGDTLNTRSYSDKLKLWFMPTGWRPLDCTGLANGQQQVLQKSGSENHQKYDPQVSQSTRRYVAFSMSCIMIIAVMFLFLTPQLSALQWCVGVITLIGGVIMNNRFLQGEYSVWFVELVRWPLVIWLAVQCWTFHSETTLIHSTKLPGSPMVVLNYAGTPSFWPEWHPSSTQIWATREGPLNANEHFKEQIQVTTGLQSLEWTVIEHLPGKRWIAEAINDDNGVKVKLQYEVESEQSSDSQTLFTRTLSYELPNFGYTVFNQLYFKKQTDKTSVAALERLKQALASRNDF